MAKHKSVNVILKIKDLDGFKFIKYRNVTDLNNLLAYVEKRHEIDYINLYDSITKEKIKGISYKVHRNI